MRYVIGYDGSAASKKAIEKAFSLLHPDRDEVMILAMVEKVPTYDWPFIDEAAAARMTIAASEKAKQTLKDLEDTFLKEHPGVKYSTVIGLVNELREGLLQEAKSLEADILVVGTKGGSALTRLALGSVSDFAVRNAHLPVLVVPE